MFLLMIFIMTVLTSLFGFDLSTRTFGTVILLFGWCIYEVLTTPNETEKVHGVEFHTRDMDADI